MANDRFRGAHGLMPALCLMLALAVIQPMPAWAQISAGDMAVIPAGAFIMGRDDGPADERPAHSITLAAYRIDRYPVTNARFAEFLNAVGPLNRKGERLYDFDDPDARIHQPSAQQGVRWQADPGHEQHPVVEVSWAGARDYCLWRSKRLPTEAEWEKAARGTDARRYPWGNTIPDPSRAQYDSAFNATAPVYAHPAGASPHGVQDMAGNAWEWVASAYRTYPYRDDDGRENPAAGPVRSTRGGGHDSPAAEITATQRGRTLSRNPRAGHHNIAFRCAVNERI